MAPRNIEISVSDPGSQGTQQTFLPPPRCSMCLCLWVYSSSACVKLCLPTLYLCALSNQFCSKYKNRQPHNMAGLETLTFDLLLYKVPW